MLGGELRVRSCYLRGYPEEFAWYLQLVRGSSLIPYAKGPDYSFQMECPAFLSHIGWTDPWHSTFGMKNTDLIVRT